MSRLKKVLPVLSAVAVLAAVLTASLWPRRSEVTVEISPVRRRNLISIARATGQIIPTRYVNVLGQGFGRITGIFVHPGQFVRPGDLLLQVDPVQAAANVRAQQAIVDSAQAALRAARAALQSAQARVAQGEATLSQARLERDQEENLYRAGVISRQTIESYRTTFHDARASLAAARAQVAVALSEQIQAKGRFEQAKAVLVRDQDVLNKTTYRAPMAGTVTDIGVHVGENVIPGVPEASGAYLMTISDMSATLAQVRVDENDVTYIHAGQPASVRINAFPGRTFSGRVEQVGTQAIVSASGMTTSQALGTSSGQQATDYKVDIRLSHAPKGLLAGMTVTSVIQTTQKKDAMAVPFQALVLRPKEEAGRTSLPRIPPAAPVNMAAAPTPQGQQTTGVPGVFVVRSGRAIFTPVRIGVLGESDVEILSGLEPGEEIVVGGYAALRDLRSGMKVRVVNRAG